MKKSVLFLVLLSSVALICPALAQPGAGGGRGPQLYNPQTVTTVKGKVERLEQLPSMGRGGGRGMMYNGVLLSTAKGPILVRLGPTWYMSQEKFTIMTGDPMEVTGSQVTLNNQPAIIAKEVTVKNKTLKLRDDQGLPVWRGRGMGPGRGRRGGPAGR
jgi:hypothetical protein